jgi:hypothetical protein
MTVSQQESAYWLAKLPVGYRVGLLLNIRENYTDW